MRHTHTLTDSAVISKRRSFDAKPMASHTFIMDVDTPEPDPMIGEAAKANSEIGKEALALQKQQYADQKAITDKYMPVFEEQIKLAQAEQAKSTARSDQQWESYQRDFAPLESELAKKALEYNTAGRQTMEADRAAADVSQNFGLARQRMAEEAAASGGLPGSGASSANANAMAIEEAKARAGASNTARRQVESQGLAYLDNAARFGRNMSSTGLAAASLAGQQGGQAQGSVGGLSQLVAAPVQQSQGLFSTAVGANASSANTLLGLQQAKSSANSSNNGMFGDLLGAGLQAYGMGMKKSTKTAKHMGKPVSGKKALAGLMSLESASWRYKDGEGDGGDHVGTYAEDTQAAFGDGVAPGGKMLNLKAMGDVNAKAIAELGKELKSLKAELKAMG